MSSRKALVPSPVNVLASDGPFSKLNPSGTATTSDAAVKDSCSRAASFPALATVKDRARALWTELSADRSGFIRFERFSNFLQDLDVDLEPLEIRLIFEDADIDSDGKLSANEFVSTFAHHYATLLEILCIRCRDACEIQRLAHKQQQAEADASKRQLELTEVHRSLGDAKQKLSVKKVSLSSLTDGQRGIEKMVMEAFLKMESARQELARATSMKRERGTDVAVAEDLCALRAQEAESWKERLIKWDSATDALREELAVAEAKERTLREQYEAAKAHAEEKRLGLTEAIRGRELCEQNHSQALLDLDDAVEQSSELLQQMRKADQEWQSCLQSLQAYEKSASEARETAQHGRVRIDQLAKDLSALQQEVADGVQRGNSIARDAEISRADSEAFIRQMEELLAARASKNDQELSLIRKELELRKEKRSLLLKEISLRSTAAAIYTT